MGQKYTFVGATVVVVEVRRGMGVSLNAKSSEVMVEVPSGRDWKVRRVGHRIVAEGPKPEKSKACRLRRKKQPVVKADTIVKIYVPKGRKVEIQNKP